MERNTSVQEVKHEISLFFVVMEMLVLFSLITSTWATFLLCIYRILYRFILVINYCICLCFIRFYRLCINIPPSCGRSCHWRCWRWSVVLHQDFFGQAEKGVLNNICNDLWWEWLTTTARLISSKSNPCCTVRLINMFGFLSWIVKLALLDILKAVAVDKS